MKTKQLTSPRHLAKPLGPASKRGACRSRFLATLLAAFSGLLLPGLPATADNWREGSNDGAPSPRSYPAAVWTGREMIIWGGYDGSVPTTLITGARYDPVANRWTALPTNGAPSGRYAGPSSWPVVWTGSEMIVWGGADGVAFTATGARYNTNSNGWTPISTNGAPEARGGHVAVWTGSEMLVWGGYNGSTYFATGGRYNPANNTWIEMSTNGAPSPRASLNVVWTGREMIVWGGGDASTVVNTGGRYDPALNRWRPISTTNVPTARWTHGAVWTGTQMIVWGGRTFDNIAFGTGGRYDPASDTWTAVTTSGAPVGRWGTTPVWSGKEMLVWGGDFNGVLVNDGGRYDPAADRWAVMTTSGAPSARWEHSVVWTGESMIPFGGAINGSTFATGTFLYTPPSPCSNCPPAILDQPLSQTVLVGGSAFFSVTASGTSPLTYQWRKDDMAISAATNASFTIAIAQTNDAGSYSVLVSNSYGSATSSNALLTVREPEVHYVNLNNPAPTAPYTSWDTAATVIQDAIDVALPGDEVVVTNGVYATGGRGTATDLTTNRVAITKPITVRSVNGQGATVIQGSQFSAAQPFLVRCVYLTDGASLTGFTLTNGSAQYGGGAYCESEKAVISNCLITANCADLGGGVRGGTLASCVLVTNVACLDGGGAIWATLIDCVLRNNAQTEPQDRDNLPQGGGGTDQCRLERCTLAGNTAMGDEGGGGSSGSTLEDCSLVANFGTSGGAAAGSTLLRCVIATNSAFAGGGVDNSSLSNCTLIGNRTISEFPSLSPGPGGGAYRSSLQNCFLTANTASVGGGAYGGVLKQCTLACNSATQGGGVAAATLTNCVVYFNSATLDGLNFLDDPSLFMSHCCTKPLPTNGVSVVTDDPLLATASHLGAGSPCRGVGDPAAASGVDIDGEAWLNPPSIGCDEVHDDSARGPLSVSIVTSGTNFATGFEVGLRTVIVGFVTGSAWDYGDGFTETNRPYASHHWIVGGDYRVTLRAWNLDNVAGVSATATVHVIEAPITYVATNGVSPAPPYGSWATAARSLQAAVDAAPLGALILVSNGIYQTDGRVVDSVSNRVAVTKPVTVRSVNGPGTTLIQGSRTSAAQPTAPSVRCVYLANGAVLAGFTLTNGTADAGGGVRCESTTAVVTNCVLMGNAAGDFGGGVYSGTLLNCILAANSAQFGGGSLGATLENCALTANSAYSGGGAYGGMLSHCTLTGNTSVYYGGGASDATLNNCTVVQNTCGYGGGACSATLNNCALLRNTAAEGGGALWSTLNNCTLVGNVAGAVGGGANGSRLINCIVYDNTVGVGGVGANYDGNCTLHYCCTVPQPATGFGHITAPPLLANPGGNDVRLRAASPCINAGLNGSAPSGLDLDGRPRIVGGTVDVGAYEFQTPASRISYAWLRQYGLPTDGSADGADPDGDRMNNYQEWRAGTNPSDAQSALRLKPPLLVGSDLVVTWESVPGRTYFLEGSTNLALPMSFHALATNIPGQAGSTTCTHTNAAGAGPFFYRVGVED